MRSVILVLLTVHSCVGVFDFFGREQSVAATGQLTCNEAPAKGIKVKLYDIRFPLDLKLAQSRTDEEGGFMVKGTARRHKTLKPKVNVYHKCNYTGFCYRKVGITIPPTFVSNGSVAEVPFDIGIVSLNDKFEGETIDCFN